VCQENDSSSTQREEQDEYIDDVEYIDEGMDEDG
jgi:hypothetical protein